jgi:hypothetical protein
MRSISSIIVCMCAAAAVGCPGTLDDATDYEGYGETAAPSGPPPLDGSTPPSAVRQDAASSWDASTRQYAEASTPPESWADAGGRPASADAAAGWSEGGARKEDAASADAADSASACDFRALMQARCGNASCHGGPMASTGLDLTSAGLAERVKGQRANAACSQYLLIDVAKPEQSALYLKVTNEACGVRMPVGGSLSSSEQACVLQWIDRL